MLCIQLGIDSVQIFGDSMNVINWVNNSQICQNIMLLPILEEIHALKLYFLLIYVFHIYREYNRTTGGLSKDSLQRDMEAWHIIEKDENGVRVLEIIPY